MSIHTFISILYFWFVPSYTWEAILPKRQFVPKPPIEQPSFKRVSDTTKQHQFKKKANSTSRKMMYR